VPVLIKQQESTERVRPTREKPKTRSVPPGLAARTLAAHLVAGVLIDEQPLEQVLAACSARPQVAAMEPRDRALARLVAATVLRRQGELEHVLNAFLERPLPADKGRLWPILLTGAAQLVCLGMPAHAVVDLSVEATRRDRGAHRFAKLVNAVLRRVAERGPQMLAVQDGTRLNIPDWLRQRWSAAYGPDGARRIAEASLAEAALDISVKPGRDGSEVWAVAAAGARVTAVDVSAARLGRLRENLARLRLEAEVVEADAATWAPGRTFDVVVLDAPCTATGTIRRHPDILRLKRPEDVGRMATLQLSMLAHAASLVSPGGLLVYSTCSLEAEEGVQQVAAFLAGRPEFERAPISAGQIGGDPDWLTPLGELRTLPFHMQLDAPGLSGLDGFFVARLRRKT
jgi:16S rRNA (cytosine967-C5)-methyltransferase